PSEGGDGHRKTIDGVRIEANHPARVAALEIPGRDGDPVGAFEPRVAYAGKVVGRGDSLLEYDLGAADDGDELDRRHMGRRALGPELPLTTGRRERRTKVRSRSSRPSLHSRQ